MPLNYITGDATKPIGTGNRIITHCCNDRGFWNAGFVKALSRRWSEPERAYRRWAAGNDRLPFALGNVQFVKVETGLCVANLVGQSGISTRRQKPSNTLRRDSKRIDGGTRTRPHLQRLHSHAPNGSWLSPR